MCTALLLLIETAGLPTAAPSGAHAQAVTRIRHATVVTQARWNAGATGQRREIHRWDEAGRLIILRLIENE
jgi:hypothetical protein